MPGLFYMDGKKGTIARGVNGWKGDVGGFGNGCAKVRRIDREGINFCGAVAGELIVGLGKIDGCPK